MQSKVPFCHVLFFFFFPRMDVCDTLPSCYDPVQHCLLDHHHVIGPLVTFESALFLGGLRLDQMDAKCV